MVFIDLPFSDDDDDLWLHGNFDILALSNWLTVSTDLHQPTIYLWIIEHAVECDNIKKLSLVYI